MDGRKKLDEATLARLSEMAFSQCTLCRRCTFNCPMGVDTPLMMRAIRAMATASGTAPEILVMLADAAIEKGKDPCFYRDMFIEQMADLEKELQAKVGDPNGPDHGRARGAPRCCMSPSPGAHTILPPAIIFARRQGGLDPEHLRGLQLRRTSWPTPPGPSRSPPVSSMKPSGWA